MERGGSRVFPGLQSFSVGLVRLIAKCSELPVAPPSISSLTGFVFILRQLNCTGHQSSHFSDRRKGKLSGAQSHNVFQISTSRFSGTALSSYSRYHSC